MLIYKPRGIAGQDIKKIYGGTNMIFRRDGMIDRLEQTADNGKLVLDIVLYPKHIREFLALGIPVVPAPQDVAKRLPLLNRGQRACRVDISLGQFAPKGTVLRNLYQIYLEAIAATEDTEEENESE